MSYSTEVLADSPVAYWKFDETSGTSAADSSGNSRTATHFNGVSVNQTSLLGDSSGKSCSYDRTDDYTAIASASWMNQTTAYTIEARVQPNSGVLANTGFVVGRWVAGGDKWWYLGVNSSAKAIAKVFLGGTEYLATGATTLTAGTNYTLAARWDQSANKLHVFVNGVADGNVTTSGSVPTTGSNIEIGRIAGANGSGLSWGGLIDEVSITMSALSDSRLLARHNAAIALPTITGDVAATLPHMSASLAGTVTDEGTIAVTLPSLSASIAGTAQGVDGTIQATLPHMSATVAGAVTIPGAVAATLPSLSADVAGAVTIPAAVAATLPHLSASIDVDSGVPVGEIIHATLPSLSAAITGTSTPDLTTVSGMSMTGGGTLDTTSLTPVKLVSGMSMSGGGRLAMRVPQDWNADPRTGRPQWNFVIAQAPTLGGALLCQVKVAVEAFEEDVEDLTSGAFTIATRDPKHAHIDPVVTWFHAYRGSHHMGGGPILPGPAKSQDGAFTTYQWRDPRWLLSGDFRPIKQIPRRDLLRNGNFKQGLLYWTGGWDPGTIPAAVPITTIVDSDFEPGGKAMQITGADKTQLITSEVATQAVFVPNSPAYLPGGEAHIQAVGTAIPNGSTVQIVGHTADDGTGSGLTLSLNRALAARATLLAQDPTLTFVLPSLWPHDVTSANVVGRGYYEKVPGGLAANRRVTISYEGVQTALSSAQWRQQTVRVTQPADAGRPLRISPVGLLKITDWIGENLVDLAAKVTVTKVGETVPISTATVAMTNDTARGVRLSTSELEGNLDVEVPANGLAYDVTLTLYAPAGTIDWEQVHLYPDDGLYFNNIDQALIVKGIVDHAQSTAKGWAPLGFTTRTPLTGVKRKREYPYYLQRPTLVALEEFPQLYRGIDISCEVTPAGAVIATHSPRRGMPSDLVLRAPGNVAQWEQAATRDVASLVIAQADGSGIARPEEYAIDDTALGGMRLGGIFNAENETPLNELDEFARLQLSRARFAVTAWWVSVPARYTTEVLQRIGMGDTARLSIPPYDGLARLIKRTPVPDSDWLRLLMARED